MEFGYDAKYRAETEAKLEAIIWYVMGAFTEAKVDRIFKLTLSI